MSSSSCYLLLITLTIIICLCPLHAEIHRARSVQTFKHRFRNVDSNGKPSVNQQTPTELSMEWTKWLDENVWGHPRRVWLFSFVSAGLVGLTGLFPLLVIPANCGSALRSEESGSKLKMLLSFAVGGLLGDVFLHLLPEAWAHAGNYSSHLYGYRCIGLWFLAGLLSFFFIEKLFVECEDKIEENEKKTIEANNNDVSEETSSVGSDDSSECDSSHGFARSVRKERAGHPNCIKRVNKSQKKLKKKVSGASDRSINESSVLSSLSLTSIGSTAIQSVPLEVSLSASSLPSIKSSSASLKKKDNSNGDGHIKVSGWLNLLANVVDNFTHGLAVAGSYCISSKMGVLTTFAILLHEIPHEIGDFAILLQAGFDRWKAAKAQILTASGGIIGAMLALSAESVKIAGDSTAWILPFTAGGFVNIALVAIVPDLLKETKAKNSMKQLILVCTGISVMGLVTTLVD